MGYEEGGQLSEAVRRRPYSVVLFDEVEKAHPDVMHLLLQILEEGKITDSLGQKIDFRNTIIIMTSNVGAELIKRQTALGFRAVSGHGSYEAMRDKILDESKRVFKPEFLNRLDDMIVFHQLERNDLVKIVDIEVAKVVERVRAKDIKVHLEATAIEFLIHKGYDPPTARGRCAARWKNTSKTRWPRNSCEVTLSRATRWRCTWPVNNWHSR